MQNKIGAITEGILDIMAILGSIGYILAVAILMLGFLSSLTFHIFDRSFYVTVLLAMVISLAVFAVGIIGLSVIGRIEYFDVKKLTPAGWKGPNQKATK